MLGWLLLLGGCGEGPPETPCEAEGPPTLEITPADSAFGEFTDGDPLGFGPPPQGGAPYTPLRARAAGLADMEVGVTIELWGFDADGADLGEVSYETRLVCANVGDSAGAWLASDLHFRYFGWGLDELEGRVAEIGVRMTDTRGDSVEAGLIGTLRPL